MEDCSMVTYPVVVWLRGHALGEQGQGLAEYALIVTFIAVVVAVTLATLGTNVSQMFTTMADFLR
jgi:Flp pilus assembly pilin Flp